MKSLANLKEEVVEMRLSRVGTTCLNDTIMLDYLDKELAQLLYCFLSKSLERSLIRLLGDSPNQSFLYKTLRRKLDKFLRQSIGRSNQEYSRSSRRKPKDLLSGEEHDRIGSHLCECSECWNKFTLLREAWVKGECNFEREDYEAEEEEGYRRTRRLGAQ